MSEYSKKLKISEKMADIITSAPNYLYTWLEGSAQSGKSCTAALAMSLIIENSSRDDNLFIALGYTVTSAKNNIFECGGFGVRHYFGSRCEPCKYMGIADALKIKTKTGIKYLVAFGTSTKTANNSWHGWRVSGFIFDEIDRACPESIDEMKQRITAVNDPHIICTQNPNVPSHQIYKFLNDLIDRNLVYYSHWMLDDNIALTPEKIKDIKDRYDASGIYYRRYINGERVNPEGAIFKIRDDVNILNSYDENKYRNFITVCDKGENKSATVFLLIGSIYNEDTHQKELHILKEYHHLNFLEKSDALKKSPQQYADDYAQFILDGTNQFSRTPEKVLFDGTGVFFTDLRQGLIKRNIGNIVPKYVIKETDEVRIIALQNYLYSGKIKIYKDCVNTIQDIKNAVYDDKAYNSTGKISRLEDFNNLGHGDCIDSVDYAITFYKSFLS